MKVSLLLLITVCTAIAMATEQVFVHPLGVLFQWIFFGVLVFVIGVPHGALDLYVQQQSDQLSGKPFRTGTFLLKYCGLIFLYAVAWYLFPGLAFLLFLFISCLHFGKTDLTWFAPATNHTSVATLLYGVALLLILLLPHIKEVMIVVPQLLPAYSLVPECLAFLQTHVPILTGISIFVVLGSIALQLATNRPNREIAAPLLLLILLGCCSLLPLLLAFALYFVGWHSIISLQQIGCYIKENNTKSANENYILPLLKKGLPFSCLAIAGLVITYFLLSRFSISFRPLPLILIFLSLITLPHLQVMNELNEHLPTRHSSH